MLCVCLSTASATSACLLCDFPNATGPTALAGKGESHPSQAPNAITGCNFGEAPAAT